MYLPYRREALHGSPGKERSKFARRIHRSGRFLIEEDGQDIASRVLVETHVGSPYEEG